MSQSLPSAGAPHEEPQPPAAVWKRIYHHLLAQIATGQLRPGMQLPGENSLAESLNVTRNTLRQALGRLQQEGHLAARKGVGVFVRAAPPTFSVRDGRRFSASLAAQGRAIGTRTHVLIRSAADGPTAAALAIAEGDEVVRLERVRTLDGQPIYANLKIFPAALFPRFEEAYAAGQSVSDVFAAHGVGSYRRVETRVRGGFAGADESARLTLSPGMPVLHTASINENEAGRRIEWTRGCWPLTAVEFVFDR